MLRVEGELDRSLGTEAEGEALAEEEVAGRLGRGGEDLGEGGDVPGRGGALRVRSGQGNTLAQSTLASSSRRIRCSRTRASRDTLRWTASASRSE